ncbi:hypothetical protein PINS_up023603 [Pythium insidiosum]|nr:hypothetical protein PINS_up023603 [Pythium insidiosum]
MELEKFVRLQAAARLRTDKFAKTIGYGCGFRSDTCWRSLQQKDSDVSTGLKQISSNISMARYVIRSLARSSRMTRFKNGSWCLATTTSTSRALFDFRRTPC